MINPPLRHILTLVCLAETGSFRGAAQRLKLSQPAVSAHIRDLEGHFGVPLVYRTTRHVSLTAEGSALAARARRAFDELEMASQDLRDLAAVHRGRVVVACIPPMMADIVPRVVRRIAETYPAVTVQILDVLSNQVEQLVERGDADFGIGPGPASASVAFEKLIRDDFVAAMPLDHPLAGRESVKLAELASYPMITMTRDANARQIIDRALQRLRHPLKPQFELTHNFSVGRMVAAGLGLTILPALAIPTLGSEKLKVSQISAPRLYRDIGVMTRNNYHPSPAAKAFISELKAVVAGEMSKTPSDAQDIRSLVGGKRLMRNRNRRSR